MGAYGSVRAPMIVFFFFFFSMGPAKLRLAGWLPFKTTHKGTLKTTHTLMGI